MKHTKPNTEVVTELFLKEIVAYEKLPLRADAILLELARLVYAHGYNKGYLGGHVDGYELGYMSAENDAWERESK